MAYDAFIFDNDGVLTNPTHDSVWQSANKLAFQDHGVIAPNPTHVQTFSGRTVSEIRSISEEYRLDAEAFWRTRERRASEAQREEIVRGRKCLYDDVQLLKEIEVPIGIVSNNQQATIETIVDHFELSELTEVAYGREQTIEGLGRTKPNPHYLERAIADLNANKPLYVGDSAVDIAAANELGVDSAFIRRSHRSEYDLCHKPTYEYEDLWGLREHLNAPNTVTETHSHVSRRRFSHKITTNIDESGESPPKRRPGSFEVNKS